MPEDHLTGKWISQLIPEMTKQIGDYSYDHK